MKNPSTASLGLYLCLALPVIAAPPQQAQASKWRMSISPFVRNVQGPDFNVRSGVSSMSLPSLFGVHVGIVAPAAAGAEGAYADRTYDNGFVNQDAGTPTTGSSAAWGYNDNAQYSGGAGGVLTMNIASGSSLAGSAHVLSSSQSLQGRGASGDDAYELGFHLELDYLSQKNERFRSGPVLGFSFFTGGGNSGSQNAFSGASSANDYSVGVVDSFQLGAGVVAPLAPYSNSGGGPGPLIPNQPSSRSLDTALTNSEAASFESMAAVNFDYRAIVLDAGYRGEWQHDKMFTNLTAGAALNILDWSAAHRENAIQTVGGVSSTYATVEQRNSGVDVLAGLYLQAGTGYHLSETISLSGFFRYDLTETFSKDVGPSAVEQDLSGWSFGLGVTHSF